MKQRSNRRDFLKQTSLAGVGFWVAGGLQAADSKSANDKLNFACIGVGGKGGSDTDNAAAVGNIVALCDCDENTLNQKAAQFPNAKKYTDYRKMFDEMAKSIDAVTVSTPDHTHAPASVMAMRLKKHVYCQKPLTHTVYEARRMREIAKEMGVCTQMGNQGTAANGLRRAAEFIQDGGIGKVTQVHVWTNRPIWPQAPAIMARPKGTFECPKHVHWDLFLGSAPERPYAPDYHPFKWRGWWDFGTGALGDMACHTANMAFMALKLAHPISASAEAGDLNPETYPSWARVILEFPARGEMAPVTWNWYEGKRDGKHVLPAPELVPGQKEREKANAVFFKDGQWHFRRAGSDSKRKDTVDSGSFLVGEKGVLFSPDDYGAEAYIVTTSGVERLTGEPKRMPINNRGDLGMKQEWVKAIKENKPEIAVSNFDYSGMLTEAVLLGNVAIRMMGKKLQFDGPSLHFTNNPEANQYLRTEYRKGWTL
jgi:predicted dehydrogenase